MAKEFTIKSYTGAYSVVFESDAFKKLSKDSDLDSCHFIIDKKVAHLYRHELGRVLKSRSVVLIEAREQNKSFDKFNGYIEHLLHNKVRRSEKIVAIGGGIIQDIILKVHAIAGRVDFKKIAQDYDSLVENKRLLEHYIYRSLEIKKGFIEKDEFDKGIRNILNYGHSFGHAIESATHFKVPHGMGVSMGMDMAGFIAYNLGLARTADYEYMHAVLVKNYRDCKTIKVPVNAFIDALSKDKKNTATKLALILPDSQMNIKKVLIPNNAKFKALCKKYLGAAAFV